MPLPRNSEYIYYIEEPSGQTIYTPITGDPDDQASPIETTDASADESTGRTIPSISWNADSVTPTGSGNSGTEGVAPPSYPNIPVDPIPQIRYKTVVRKSRVVVENFDPEALEALHDDQGAEFFVIYTDGTEDEVEWTEVYDPKVTSTELITFEADDVGAASNQHFWHDTNGAHVTDDEQNAWNTEYAKTGHGDLANPTDLEPWHNILMNSLGILLRRGLVNLVSFSKSAFAFYDGSGNQNSNITAFFGRNSAQIGKDTEKHLVINSSGITVYNGDGTVAPLQASNISAAEANIQQLQADTADISTIRANSAKVSNLTANQLSAASGYIESLTSSNVSANDISANKATIASLISGNVTVNTLRVASAFIASLASSNISASNIVADHADISDLKANKVDVSDLEADYITADTIEATYMKADISNADVAWIQNGVIKDGSISNAMIASVSANKLTAGTIDASNITVTNLNADNITTGTINGQRIGEGSLSLSKLADDVYTEAEVDAILSNMQTQIDGAIETWTGTAVPTLNNAPASSWTTAADRDKHVGDVYFVVNSDSQQNGYNYRFTKSGSTYSWQLIKDNDVTNALARLTTAEGKIGTIEQFDSDISAWKTDTDEELASIKSNHTTLAGRVTTAEGTLATKVDTTTFNTLSQTVDGNTSSIQSLTTEQTTLSGRIDNIKIGGRNLLRGTINASSSDWYLYNATVPELGVLRITPPSNSSAYCCYTVDYLDYSEYNNRTYTFSFDVRRLEGSYTNKRLRIIFGFNTAARIGSGFSSTKGDSSDYFGNIYIPADEITSGDWTRISIKFSVPDDLHQGSVNALIAGSQLTVQPYLESSGNPVEIRRMKLEAGTLATDWTPAPEDVESQITKNTTKINEVSDTVDEHTQKIGILETTVETKADGSSLETVSNRLNTVSDTVDGHTQSISSITSTQSTLSGRIDDAQEAIDNISIGGRNLLMRTAEAYENTKNYYNPYPISNAIPMLDPTDELTISFEAKASEARWLDIYWTNVDTPTGGTSYNNTRNFYPAFQITTEWVRYTYTGEAGENVADARSMRFRQSTTQHGSSSGGPTIWLRNVKLERGNRATDWTPAPEDVESQITKNTTKINEVSDTVDEHTQKIGILETTVETKADGSSLETVSNRLNSVSDTVDGHTQSISSINSTLSSKADGSTVSSLTTRVNNISDTVDGHTSSLSSITSTQTTIQQNAVKSTVQLWFTKANTTAPNKPTAHVTTNDSATGNAWNLAVPTYNASYPNYYYCYEYEYLNGSYGWSAVTRDIATEEAQERARTAITNAATADTKAENAATAASNAQADIDNLEIGGRNLLQSSVITNAGVQGSTKEFVLSPALLRAKFGNGNFFWDNFEEDVQYTFSVSALASNQFDSGWGAIFLFSYTDGSANTYIRFTFDEENEVRKTMTSTKGKTVDKLIGSYGKGDSAWTYKELKLEKGTRATDWTPAPEDIDADISAAQTSADNAQATADKNVKESIQLWITKSTNTSPAKPTVAVTSTATTGNAWTTVVPIYNDTYPHYFYCMQYKLADDSYIWSDVVYDQATTEAQSVARTTSSNLTTLQNDYATFKQTTQNFESTIGSTYATKTELGTAQTTLQTNIDNIKIGGENLLVLDTVQLGRLLEDGSVYTTGSSDGQQHVHSDFIKIEPGSKYVLTRYIKDNVQTHVYFYTNWYDVDKQPISRTNINDYANVDPGYDILTAPDNAEYVRISMGNRFVPLSAVKFEKGTVPTDWSPSNYDANNTFNLLRGTNQPDVLTGWQLNGSWSKGHWRIGSGTVSSGGAVAIEIGDFIDNSGFKIRYGFRVWSTTTGNKDIAQDGLINVLKAGLYRLILAVRLTPDQEQTSATLQVRAWGNGSAQITKTVAVTSTEWRITSVPIDLTTKYANLNDLNLLIGVKGNGSLDICRIYLKEGLRALTQPAEVPSQNDYLPWRPAIEDNAPYTQTNALISAVEERVTTAETSITQTNEAIALKANASDVYTKTQTDGLISTEVSNRNTAIEQSADAVKLFASQTYSTKTDTSQMAQPNLSPYFSHPTNDIYKATTNPDGYWYNTHNNWTFLTNGWAHISLASSSSTQYANFYIHKIPEDFKSGTIYTVLVEWRNLETDDSSIWIAISSASGTLIDPFSGGAIYTYPTDEFGSTYTKVTTRPDISDSVLLSRSYLAVHANYSVSGDFRISIYEGEYSGPYKPYIDQSLSSRVSSAEASLTVQAGQIESKVSADGVISSINQTPETVKIQANRVEIDGEAIFSNSDFRSAADNAYDSKGAAAEVQDSLENLIDNSNIVVSVYPVSINWNTEIATLGVRCLRDGQIVTPTGYSWTRDSLTSVLGTSATLDITDLDAVYNCTVTFNV